MADSVSGRNLQGYGERLLRHLRSGSKAVIRPGRSFFALGFRHDLDGMDQADLARFLDLHQGFKGGSTDFVLGSQFRSWRGRVGRLLSLDHEIALHSEARPLFMISSPKVTRLLESQYRRRLVGQKELAQRFSGLPLAGHAPHDVHNYLPFDLGDSLEIIGQATLRTGLAYLADFEAAARAASGSPRFPLPNPPYIRSQGRSRIVVLPVGWDDKIFWASWAHRHLEGWPHDFLDVGLEQAWESLLGQMEACREARRPLIVSLHPYWFVRGRLPTWELKQRALEWAAAEGVAVLKHMDLAARAVE